MRYAIRQKILALGDRFTIQDAERNDVFVVRGKLFSWGDDLSVQDLSGGEQVRIRQRLLSLRPRYEIYRGGELFAEITKQITFLKDRFVVDVPGPNDYTVRGSVFDHEYTFERSGREVARVSKTLLSFRDSYGIDIVDGEDDVLILAVCVVIDMVSHDRKD